MRVVVTAFVVVGMAWGVLGSWFCEGMVLEVLDIGSGAGLFGGDSLVGPDPGVPFVDGLYCL